MGDFVFYLHLILNQNNFDFLNHYVEDYVEILLYNAEANNCHMVGVL